MTENIVLDTTIHEPSTTAGEVEMLPSPWSRTTAPLSFLTGEPIGPPWDAVDFEADPDWEWRTAADDSPAELYRLWRDAVERSRAAMARVLADGGLDQPSKFTTPSGEHPNLRRVLVDQIEEYIRHTGHADLLREAVDGLVGEDPPQP